MARRPDKMLDLRSPCSRAILHAVGSMLVVTTNENLMCLHYNAESFIATLESTKHFDGRDATAIHCGVLEFFFSSEFGALFSCRTAFSISL